MMFLSTLRCGGYPNFMLSCSSSSHVTKFRIKHQRMDDEADFQFHFLVSGGRDRSYSYSLEHLVSSSCGSCAIFAPVVLVKFQPHSRHPLNSFICHLHPHCLPLSQQLLTLETVYDLWIGYVPRLLLEIHFSTLLT